MLMRLRLGRSIGRWSFWRQLGREEGVVLEAYWMEGRISER